MRAVKGSLILSDLGQVRLIIDVSWLQYVTVLMPNTKETDQK